MTRIGVNRRDHPLGGDTLTNAGGRPVTVIDDVDPDGVVEVGNGRWRARTNRATPVLRGDAIRVAAIDGITLEVEPLEGAAKDYRERRDSSDDAAEPTVAAVTDEQLSP